MYLETRGGVYSQCSVHHQKISILFLTMLQRTLVIIGTLSAATATINCGGGASCPDTNTCCRNGEGGFSCCPVKDASCCGDYVHCK